MRECFACAQCTWRVAGRSVRRRNEWHRPGQRRTPPAHWGATLAGRCHNPELSCVDWPGNNCLNVNRNFLQRSWCSCINGNKIQYILSRHHYRYSSFKELSTVHGWVCDHSPLDAVFSYFYHNFHNEHNVLKLNITQENFTGILYSSSTYSNSKCY